MNDEHNWRRYSKAELIYFSNFAEGSAPQRLLLLAHIRNVREVSDLTGVDRTNIEASARRGIKLALHRITTIRNWKSIGVDNSLYRMNLGYGVRADVLREEFEALLTSEQ